MRSCTANSLAVAAALLLSSGTASAEKITLNPSDQIHNPVGNNTGHVESEYALINANIAADILRAAGFDVRVDQSFDNSPANANSWGADEFVSIHTNAGGGHGTVTLYYPGSADSEALATSVQNGLLANLPYSDRGLSARGDLWVLRATNMPASLAEALFHDCTDSSGYQGHPPSESAFLMSASGQQAIGAGIAAGVCSHFSRSCASQPPAKGRLLGVVYRNGNASDRIPATVTLNTGASQAYGGSGSWIFELDPGTYTVTATADGYQSNSVTRTVTAGQDVWGSIDLAAIPPDPPEEDAGVPPEEDSGVPPEEDAGPSEEPDAGAPSVDAGSTPEDGGMVVDSDAGSTPHGAMPEDPDGSCGCSSASTGLLGLPLLLALYAARCGTRIRRKRQ